MDATQSAPRRVKRVRGQTLPLHTKAVDRSTRYGNPFKIGPERDRDTVIEMHRRWLAGEGPDVVGKFDRRKVLAGLPKLRGWNLACYCDEGLPCHGDTLLELVNRPRPDLGTLPDSMFEDDGVFGSRGIKREVADGAFYPYAQGDGDAVLLADPTIVARGEGAVQQALDRAQRAPGIMMRRWAVPGAEEFITAEMRPEWPIWTGEQPTVHKHADMKKNERRAHVARRKIKAQDVRHGTTPEEYKAFVERYPFARVGLGADHHGKDTDLRHVHVNVAKYIFAAQPMTEIVDPGTPHKHRWFFDAGLVSHDADVYRIVRDVAEIGDAARMVVTEWATNALALHETWKHADTHRFYAGAKVKEGKLDETEAWFQRGGDVIQTRNRVRLPLDEMHEHLIEVKDREVALARRLSIHPRSRERLENDDVERVWLVLEGCLKESSLVSAGEVTFSCPSVTLWDAPELELFADKFLRGRRVFVICDSDYSREDDDSVIRQVLLARDRLRLLRVDAHASAPPSPVDGAPANASEIRCSKSHAKHGVDDHRGPCTGRKGTVENLIVIDRRAPYGYAEWLADVGGRSLTGRKPREEGIVRDAIILNWLATHAGADGVTRVSLHTVAQGVQHELGAPTFEAAYVAVKRSLGTGKVPGNLIVQGAVEVIEPLTERVRHHFRKEYREWTGKLRIVDALQAETILTRVRDFG